MLMKENSLLSLLRRHTVSSNSYTVSMVRFVVKVEYVSRFFVNPLGAA